MKNKSMPVMLTVLIVLFILTGLTIVFVSDYYTTYGKDFSNSFLYDANYRSPLYGTKAMDGEAVLSSLKKQQELEALAYAELYQKINQIDSDAASPGQVNAREDAGGGNTGPVPSDQADLDMGKLYVVYCESTGSGGF